MSFRTHARRVRNPDLSPNVRLCAFRSCIGIYCWTGNACRSFTAIFSRYSDEFNLKPEILNPDQLVQALKALEIERNEFLERLRLFDKKRVQAKLMGQRTLSSAEQELLF